MPVSCLLHTRTGTGTCTGLNNHCIFGTMELRSNETTPIFDHYMDKYTFKAIYSTFNELLFVIQ